MSPSDPHKEPNTRLSEIGQRSDFSHYLPRLRGEFYRANAIIFWTLPISRRAVGWLDDRFHAGFREVMLHTAAREALLCPAYCLMPDHLPPCLDGVV